MSKVTNMWDDDRAIESIWQSNDTEGNYFKVGRNGVVKIMIYRECGQHAYVPWVAIYNGDGIKYRVDMAGYGITYVY